MLRKTKALRYGIPALLLVVSSPPLPADTVTGAAIGAGVGLVAGKGLGDALAGAAIGGGVGAMTQGGKKAKKAQKGAVTGAAIGAGVGLVAGKGLGDALGGAVLGGAAGAIIEGN